MILNAPNRNSINNDNKDCYCLFVAPSLHRGTINTYYQSRKYEYEGAKQKIIPITIKQLIEILKIVANVKRANIEFKHTYIKQLYDNVLESISDATSTSWVEEKIPAVITQWGNTMKKLSVA